ncbi:hypothetical protein HMPREF1062_00537, partial [Bacteroides cellulosilyticus CL02T12C19]
MTRMTRIFFLSTFIAQPFKSAL